MKADNQGRVGRLGLLTKSMYTFLSGWRDNSFYPSEISSLTRFWAFLEFKPTNFFCSNLDPLDVKSVFESTNPLGSGKAGGTGEGATPPTSFCRGSNYYYYTEFRDYPMNQDWSWTSSLAHPHHWLLEFPGFQKATQLMMNLLLQHQSHPFQPSIKNSTST